MDNVDSPPPSPILSHATRREAKERDRRLRRSTSTFSKERGKSSTHELARLLLFEEREANDLRKMVVTVTEQLREESQRADENERRAKEAILRFKAINDARIAAQQEASRVNEELKLYKLQLENAQREIYKAQEVLDSVEVQRYDAEASAARARSTARKIKEARLIDLAREQGRRMGMQEGMARGQELGYHRGRSGDYRARGIPGPYPPLDFDDVQSFDSGLDPIEEPMLNFPSPDEDAGHISPPRGPPSRVSPSRVPQVPVTPPPVVVHPPEGEIRPVPVRNTSSPLRHPTNIIPMDGFIPHADADSHIRLPPPHEMQRAPPTPEASPSTNLPQDLPQDDVPLMVPNPGSRHGYPSLEEIRHQRRQRRPGSPESQGSTTISQFELVSEPNGSTYRPSRNRSSRALSMIPESTSGGTSPAVGSRSVAGDPSRPPSASPSGRGGSVRGDPHHVPAPSPMMVPTPQAPTPVIAGVEQESRHIYRRPSYASSSSESLKPGSAARTPAGSDRSLNRRSSSSVPDITIQPPSRPSSQTPQQTPATMHGEFLSAEDAANRPMPLPGTPPTPDVNLPSVAQVPSPGLQVVSELPPGFVPMGPSTPLATPSQPPHMTPTFSPTGVPLPPSGGTSIYNSSRGGWGAPTPQAGQATPGSLPHMTPGPAPSAAGSRRSQGSRHGGSDPRHTGADPAMVALPPTTAGSSVVFPDRSLLSQGGAAPIDDSDSVSNEDDSASAVSSSLASSNDTLTTPPPRARQRAGKPRSAGSGYAAAPMPAGLQYPATPSARTNLSTPGAAGRVPLPPSTSGGTASPRTAGTYTPHRSAINLNAGLTPGARHSSLRS